MNITLDGGEVAAILHAMHEAKAVMISAELILYRKRQPQSPAMAVHDLLVERRKVLDERIRLLERRVLAKTELDILDEALEKRS